MIGVLCILLLILSSGVARAQIASPMLSPPTVVQPMQVPNGGPPQVVGYSAANTPESETITGDITFTRVGSSDYKATIVDVSGIPVGQLATMNIGVGLSAGSGSTLNLTMPVGIYAGGTGGTTSPTAGQILIAQSATAYAPMPVGGDITLATNGQVAVHKINGVTPGGTCGANQFVDVISSSGVPTCTTPTITGVPNGAPPQIVGYSATNTGESETLSGGVGGCTYTRTGANAYQLNCPGFAPLDSPTFTGTVTMPSGSWTSTTLSAPQGTFTGMVNAGTLSAPNILVNSGTGGVYVAAGGKYTQPGWNGTTLPAYWDQAGIEMMQAIGIGQTVGTDPIDITDNQNAASAVALLNNSTGVSAAAVFRASNGTNTARFGINGTGFSAYPNAAFVASDQGLMYTTGNSLPHQFFVGQNLIATIAANGFHLTNALETGSGGTGTETQPSQNQILVAQSATAYAPVSLSGDMTLASTGVATVGTSGTYIPVLYAGTATPCGITYNGQAGYYYKVGKEVVVYFLLTLTSLGTCTNTAAAVSVPFPPTLQGISMDPIQIVPYTAGNGSGNGPAAGSLLVAQGNAQPVSGPANTGAVWLGGVLNGQATNVMMANLAANSTIRGRVVYLTD
jgi:hypothetical protein